MARRHFAAAALTGLVALADVAMKLVRIAAAVPFVALGLLTLFGLIRDTP